MLSGVVMIAVWLMLLPSVGAAYSPNFVMTGFQNPFSVQDLSGEIDFTFNSTPNLYGFCANNASALLYEGQPYYGEIQSIAGNTGLLEAAYLMATYDSGGVPTVSGYTTDQSGVIIQLAIWGVTNQLSLVRQTYNGDSYGYLYSEASSLAASAQSQPGLAATYGLLQLWTVNSDGSLGAPNQGLETLTLLGGSETPIPGAILLLAPGLVGLAAVRRRFTT